MPWSLRLFSVRGIPVRVHASFLLVLLWAAYVGLQNQRGAWWRGVAFMVVFVVLLFACVVLHELGHALVAQLFGLRVKDITLWPIGGVARLERWVEKPHHEFLISAAGPAVNVFLTLVFGVGFVAAIGPGQLLQYLGSPYLVQRLLGRMDVQSLLALLVINNASLALFNLIPAFPMDGGRLLRSALALILPHGRATVISAVLGQMIGAAMGVMAIFSGNVLVGLVGVFIYLAAWQERQQIRTRTNLQGLRVRQAMQPVGLRLQPAHTLAEAAQQAARLSQYTFLVVDGERLVGLCTRTSLLAALRRSGAAALVGQAMAAQPLRVGADDLLIEVEDKLTTRGAWAAVVVDQGSVLGTLASADLDRLSDLLVACPSAFADRAASRT